MPLLEFLDELGDGDQIRYRIRTVQGQVVDFVIQYEVLVDDQMYPVVRYDGSHGHGHRDILDARGETVDKHWLPEHMDMKECLAVAVSDVKDNGHRYRDRFLERFT